MTDNDFRALFDAALAAYPSNAPAVARVRFCILWRQYVKWWRTVYQPQQLPRNRSPAEAKSVGTRPLYEKARTLGYLHAVGAVALSRERWVKKAAGGASDAPSGTAPARQRGCGEDAPAERLRVPNDDDTLSL